jgi:MYXO-CTERM domain-containing protein
MKRIAGVVCTVAAVLLLSPFAAGAAIIGCGEITAEQGGTATVTIELAVEGEEEVAGTQNDLGFDPAVFTISSGDCTINPAIGPDSAPGKTLSTNIIPSEPPRIRNLVVSLDNVEPIPSGALYTCNFAVADDAPLGEHTLVNNNAVASNPEGSQLPTTTGNCTIVVREGPTPTPTPECENDEDCPEGQVCVDGECVEATPTNTPIGFCNDNEDCPEGQVCVNNRCVTPTPSPTPIGYCEDTEDCPIGQVCLNNMCVTPTPSPTPIGYCEDNEDCPNGQVCVNNMCVAVTPTRKKGGGGGGCSCEIDPGAGGSQAGDLLAVLLPAMVLALRWRRRRG